MEVEPSLIWAFELTVRRSVSRNQCHECKQKEKKGKNWWRYYSAKMVINTTTRGHKWIKSKGSGTVGHQV